METKESSKLFVSSVVIFAIIFLLILVILSTMQNVGKNITTAESMVAKDIAERIKPAARVYVGEVPSLRVAPIVKKATNGSGETIVTQTCAMCHAIGVMGSPKLGSANDWAPRIEKGIYVLYESALNGLNMMPARGGNASLSDNDLRNAVDYMVSLVK